MKAASLVIVVFFSIGLLANWIASDVPWYVADRDGHLAMPIIQDQLFRLGLSKKRAKVNLDLPSAQTVIWPPIPFSADQTDLNNRFLPPLSIRVHAKGHARHLLGTDRLGRDVAAILVRGCRTSLYVAIFSMMIGGALGALFGAISGLFGNKLVVRRSQVLLLLATVPYCCFLYYHGIFLLSTILLFTMIVLSRIFKSSKTFSLPIDSLTLRCIEVFDSIPLLLLLLAVSSIVLQPSLTQLALLIGFLSWPRYARYVRGEVLKLKSREYIQAASVSGENQKQIALRYLLPEVMPVFMTVFVFGLASVILLESTLSFLGIGVPVDQMSWGSLLSQSRQSIKSWWLAVFPGVAIFCLVLCLNQLAAYRQSTALEDT